jgi:MFS transporter, ACDE family, multidrug resistance protein
VTGPGGHIRRLIGTVKLFVVERGGAVRRRENRACESASRYENEVCLRRRTGVRTFVATISLGSVGITLAVQAVSPSLPELQRVLDLSNIEIGWFTTAYVLPGVILTVPMGILGDRIGKRLLFCTALTVYGLCGIVQATSYSYPLFLAMRVVQGACFAAVMPLTITIIGEAFTGPQRVRALAGRNAILTGSEVVLPIGGALLAALSWRAPLLVQVVTIPLAIYSYFILEEGQTSSGSKQEYARDLFRVLRSQPGMLAILLTGFCRFLFKITMYAYLPLLLVNERGSSLTEVGIVISLTSLAAVIMATLIPAAIRRIPPSVVAMGSVLGLALSTGAFTLVPDWKWALLVGTAYGIGDGALSVLLDTYAIHTAQSHVRAGMVSVSQAARNLGKLSAPLAMTAIIAVSSVEVAFVVMAAIGAAVTTLLLPLRAMDHELQSSVESRTERTPTAAQGSSFE